MARLIKKSQLRVFVAHRHPVNKSLVTTGFCDTEVSLDNGET